MRKVMIGFAMALLWISGTVSAQQNDLDPVTITASVNPLNSSKTGRTIIVIKGDEFSKLPVRSLDELLRYVPGIEIQSRGPFGAQSDISLRGGTFQQVLVLIDGVRVNDANTGHFTSYMPIAPFEIDRIEIVKGASSALYGSEAVGGVINIITKTFAGGSLQKKQSAAAQLTGGEYNLFAANAGVFLSTGKTSFSAGIVSNNTSGQPQRGIRGFVHANTVSLSLQHVLSNQWSFAIRSAFDNRRFAAQNFYSSSVADTAQETVSSFWNQLQLNQQTAQHRRSFSAGYKNLQDSFSFNSRTPSNQNKTTLWQALATDQWTFSTNTVLTSGLQFISKKILSNDRGNHTTNQAAGFVLLNQQIGARFFATPSLRLEWNQNAGWDLVPQLNLSYKTKPVTLRASGGKTIRDADFTERFNNYNKTLVAGGQRLGNPDLIAEHSFSYEGGADYTPAAPLKMSATYFQRFHKQLIDYVLTPYNLIPRKINLSPAATYAFAKNVASVTTSGFETDIQFSQALKQQSELTARLGLVWLKSRSSDTLPSFYISSHAKFMSNFSVQYSHRYFALSITGLYKMRQAQKAASALLAPVSSDYFLLNAKADVVLIKNKLTSFIEIDNITDRSYTDLLGALMPGRWLSAGIKISLAEQQEEK